MSDDAETKAKDSLLADLERGRSKLRIELCKNSSQISKLSSEQRQLKKKDKLLNDTIRFLKSST